MKTYFKLFIILLLATQGTIAIAQDTPLRFGVNAGFNLSTASYNNPASETSYRPGLRFGVTADYYLSKRLFFQSGLTFATKGSEIRNFDRGFKEESLPTEKRTYRQMYLQLPVMVGYKFTLGKDFDLLLSAGPYVAYGVGGKIKDEISSGKFPDGSTEKKYFPFSHNQLRRFDYGLAFGLQAEYRKIRIGIGYELGLNDILKPQRTDRYRYNNRTILFTAGYMF